MTDFFEGVIDLFLDALIRWQTITRQKNKVTNYNSHQYSSLCMTSGAVFLFLFLFFTKIYFRFRNLQKNTSAALLPGGRDLVAPLRGGRDFSSKIFAGNLRWSPCRTGRPTAGRSAPPGCPRCRRPSFASPKIQKKNSQFVIILFI